MTNQNEDTRTFRPERFIDDGDEAFNQSWEILESEEASEEDQANRDNSADDRQLATDVHPPYSGAPRIADQLKEVASQFMKGKPKK